MAVLTMEAVEKLKARIEQGIQEIAAFQERVGLAEYSLASNPDLDAERAEWQEMDPGSTLREGVTQGWRFMFRVEYFAVSDGALFGREKTQEEYRRLDEDVTRWLCAVYEYRKIISKAMRRLTGKKLLGKVTNLGRRAASIGSRHHAHQQSQQQEYEQQQAQYDQCNGEQGQYTYNQADPYQPQPVQYPPEAHRPNPNPRHHHQRQPSDFSTASSTSSSSYFDSSTSSSYATSDDDATPEPHPLQEQRDRLWRHLAQSPGGADGGGMAPQKGMGRKGSVRRPKISVVAVSSSTMIESAIPEDFGERAYVGVGRVVG